MSTIVLDPQTDSVALPAPSLPPTATLANALESRRSSRAFRPDALSMETLSSLLWSGFGVNRPDSGGRTAPSAHNWQETSVFAVLPNGTYRYEAQGHRLLLVSTRDLRGATGVQDFVATAPLNLVYVADFHRMEGAQDNEREFLAGADAGCIAQNIYLYCASAGLAAVVRGLIDRRVLSAALGLKKHEHITLAQTIGLPAAA